jgi:hypothetical protein
VKTASISPERGDDDEAEDIQDKEHEQNKGELMLPKDEVGPQKKRKGLPPKLSSRKKMKSPITKMWTTLTSDDFNFIIEALNDASLEIVEKQEAKQEERYQKIKVELQGVQRALQPSRIVSTTPLLSRELELEDEPTQLRQLVDATEAHLRQDQEETKNSTQALTQVQGALEEQCSAAEREKLALQAKFDEEKAQLQQEKEHLLAEKLKVKELVNKALFSMTVVEVKTEERIPKQVA